MQYYRKRIKRNQRRRPQPGFTFFFRHCTQDKESQDYNRRDVGDLASSPKVSRLVNGEDFPKRQENPQAHAGMRHFDAIGHAQPWKRLRLADILRALKGPRFLTLVLHVIDPNEAQARPEEDRDSQADRPGPFRKPVADGCGHAFHALAR